MGVFTSNCPSCGGPIEWFDLHPKDRKCRCGRLVTGAEIEASWRAKIKMLETINVGERKV